MATTEQLETWLSAAETARHALLTGTKAVEVNSGDKAVKYTQASLGRLEAYIRCLKVELGEETGRSAAVSVRF